MFPSTWPIVPKYSDPYAPIVAPQDCGRNGTNGGDW